MRRGDSSHPELPRSRVALLQSCAERFRSAMRPRVALMVCSHASLRDDRQMARRPASNVQRQKETLGLREKPRTRGKQRTDIGHLFSFGGYTG